MSRTPRKAKRRRKYWTRESPFRCDGEIAGTTSTRPRAPRLGALLAGAINVLPTYEPSKKGRANANLIRIAMGVVAAMMVTRGPDNLGWGIAGLCIALSMAFIPTSDIRKRRWLRSASRLREPGSRPTTVAAQVHYDGRKLTVRGAEGVWRSTRPHSIHQDIRIGEAGGSWWIGVPSTSDKKGRVFWLRSRGEAIGETFDPVFDSGVPYGFTAPEPVDVCTISNADWAELHQQLWEPQSRRPPAPRNTG